jgi:hypothetical protein
VCGYLRANHILLQGFGFEDFVRVSGFISCSAGIPIRTPNMTNRILSVSVPPPVSFKGSGFAVSQPQGLGQPGKQAGDRILDSPAVLSSSDA